MRGGIMNKSRLQIFWRDLRDIKNLPSVFGTVLVMVFMVIDLFGEPPFGLEPDNLILFMLILIAIDSVIERLAWFNDIERDVRAIKTSHVCGLRLLRARNEYARFEVLIQSAQVELCISGMALDKIREHTAEFAQLLTRGCTLRFLTIDPDNEQVLQEAASFVGRRPDNLKRRVLVTLDNLVELAQTYPERVNIRVTHHRPSFGFVIIDSQTDHGFMTVGPYFFHIDKVKMQAADEHTSEVNLEPPFLHLMKTNPNQWFDCYHQDFERQWADARPWSASSNGGSSDPAIEGTGAR